MKSRHILKTIEVVAAPPLDGERNIKGVKKYRKVEKSIVVLYSYFFTPLLLCAPSRGDAENIYVGPGRMTRATMLISLR
jgi:hypothetical protein